MSSLYPSSSDDEGDRPILRAAEARGLLPALSYSEFREYAATQRPEHSAEENDITYTHYLVARGNFDDLVSFLDGLYPEYRGALVNRVTYDTYWGNTLNTCLYWNTGYTALNIYRYLTSNGARPTRDHYDEYPWETSGSLYVCPLRGRNVRDGYYRDNDEFASTYAEIQRYFPHPVVPLAAAAGAEEPLGGAGVASDLVHHTTENLLNAWRQAYSDDTVASARRFGNDLMNQTQRGVEAPSDALRLHNALLTLHDVLRTQAPGATVAETLRTLDQISASANLHVASYPIYGVAMEYLYGPIEPVPASST